MNEEGLQPSSSQVMNGQAIVDIAACAVLLAFRQIRRKCEESDSFHMLFSEGNVTLHHGHLMLEGEEGDQHQS